MDPVRNPFAPGAGTPPPELAGRKTVLDDVTTALQRVALGRPAQSSILVGLRGVGKTVLLVKIAEIASQKHFKILSTEAHEGKSLVSLLAPGLRSILLSLSILENAKDKARRGLRVFKSFLNGVKATYNDIEVGLSVDAEIGTADSGDLETDLPALMVAIGEAAKDAEIPVVLLIDELQYLSIAEFSALIMAIHRLSQANLPLTLVGAGLPQILGLAGESKSYAERLFRYPKIGALTQDEAVLAIVRPVEAENVSFTADAVTAILDRTQRYPYFLQQWAHDAWNIAQYNQITLNDVETADAISIASLDENFFQVRFDRCNPSEKRYMRALAELGTGSHRSADVAIKLNSTTTKAGFTRNSLIKKGMVFSPQHGDTEFTVPLFDQYMRRAVPQFD